MRGKSAEGEMTILDVTFDSDGVAVAGHLYVPEPATRAPAVVVGHPGTGVKEQAAGLYARRLSEHGFVTLAYDAAFQGESGGEPRGLEDPAHRIEDIKAAVSYLGTREDVDPERIAVLGICASGGYGLAAAATDQRIRAIGTVCAVDIARQFRFGADGAQDPAVLQDMLSAAAAARTREAHGAGVQSFRLFPDTVEEAEAAGGRHGVEGFEYYCTDRAGHPRSAKALPWSSVDRIATFDAFSALEMLGPRPLLMIAGREAVTAWMSVEAYQTVTGPKELFWIDGASHVDLYDKPEFVDVAVCRLVSFYRTSLCCDTACAAG